MSGESGTQRIDLLRAAICRAIAGCSELNERNRPWRELVDGLTDAMARDDATALDADEGLDVPDLQESDLAGF